MTQDANGTHYSHYDILGSLVVITDGDGNIENTYKYGPFGNIIKASEKHEYSDGYTGHEYDAETDLHYANARYLDQRIGRWMSKDRASRGLKNPQGLNRWGYVLNNPIKYLDSTGFASVDQLDYLFYNYEEINNRDHLVECARMYREIESQRNAGGSSARIDAVFFKIFENEIVISDLQNKTVLAATLEYGLKYEQWEHDLNLFKDLSPEQKTLMHSFIGPDIRISSISSGLFFESIAKWGGGKISGSEKRLFFIAKARGAINNETIREMDMKNNWIGARIESLAPGDNVTLKQVVEAYEQAIYEWNKYKESLVQGIIPEEFYEENSQ